MTVLSVRALYAVRAPGGCDLLWPDSLLVRATHKCDAAQWTSSRNRVSWCCKTCRRNVAVPCPAGRTHSICTCRRYRPEVAPRSARRSTIPCVSPKDRLSFFIGVGAIVVTLGVGTCSTNVRFDDVNRRIDDVNARFEARFDDVQADIRELRALIIDAIKNGDPAD